MYYDNITEEDSNATFDEVKTLGFTCNTDKHCNRFDSDNTILDIYFIDTDKANDINVNNRGYINCLVVQNENATESLLYDKFPSINGRKILVWATKLFPGDLTTSFDAYVDNLTGFNFDADKGYYKKETSEFVYIFQYRIPGSESIAFWYIFTKDFYEEVKEFWLFGV